MKRFIGMVLLSSVVALTFGGCHLLKKKEEPAAEGDQAQADQGSQGGGYQMDLSTMVKAPAKVTIGPGAQVGWMARQEATSGGQTYPTQIAIVGDAGDAWQVEYVYAGLTAMASMAPEANEMVIGMLVNKEDGKVTKAVLGKPGEKGKDIGINPEGPAAAGGEADEGVEEDVTIALGTFPAKKMENVGGSFWAGTEGELEGVLLKAVPAAGDAYELQDMPVTEEVDCGGTPVTVTKLVFTNGDQQWYTQDELVVGFFAAGGDKGMFKMVSGGATSLEITKLATDAQAQLLWE